MIAADIREPKVREPPTLSSVCIATWTTQTFLVIRLPEHPTHQNDG
jgi:hypothetical protein